MDSHHGRGRGRGRRGGRQGREGEVRESEEHQSISAGFCLHCTKAKSQHVGHMHSNVPAPARGSGVSQMHSKWKCVPLKRGTRKGGYFTAHMNTLVIS